MSSSASFGDRSSRLRVFSLKLRDQSHRSMVAALTCLTLLAAALISLTADAHGVSVTTCTGLGSLANGSFEQDSSGTEGARFSGTGFDSLSNQSSGAITNANGWYGFSSRTEGDLAKAVYQVMDRHGNQAAPVNNSASPGINGWKTTESHGNVEIQRVFISAAITNVTASNSNGTTTFTTSAASDTPFTGQEVFLSGAFTGTFSTSIPYIVSAGNSHGTGNYSGTTFQVQNLSLSGTGSIKIAYTASAEVDQVVNGNGSTTPAYDKSTVTPIAGTYEAEINAEGPGTLFQVLPTGTPGVTVRWSLYHAARQQSESMYVLIGPGANSIGNVLSDSTVESNIFSGTTYLQGTSSSNAITRITNAGTDSSTSTTITSDGAMTDSVASASDRAAGNTAAWTLYQGSYTIPQGNTNAYTAFGFQATNSGTIGNLLDDIQFSPVAACPLTDSLTTNSQVTINPFTCVALSQCAPASNSTGPALAPNPEGGASRSVTASVSSGGGSVSTSGENIIFTAPGTVGTSAITYTVDYNANGVDSQSTGTITYTVTASSGLSGCNNATTTTSYPGNDVVVTLKDSSSTQDATCNWTVPTGVYAVNYLVIGGGGGGGSGGGGAGQMVTSWPCTTVVTSCATSTPLSVTPGTVIPLTIGHGGAHGVGGEAVTSNFSSLVSATHIQAYSGDNSQFGANVIARGGGAGGVPYEQYFCQTQSQCSGVNITDLPPTGYGPYFTGTLEGINYGFSGSQNGMGAGDPTSLGSGGGAGYDTNVPSATGNTSQIVGSSSYVSGGGTSGGSSNTAGGGGGGAGGGGGNAGANSNVSSPNSHYGGVGGLAKLNSITGSALCYAGGGGAGYQNNTNSSTVNGGGYGGYCNAFTSDEVGGHGSDFATCATAACGTPGGSHAAVNASDADRTPGNSLPGLDGYPDTGSGGGGTDPDDLLAGKGANGLIVVRWTPQNSACPYNASTIPSTYPIACPASLNVYAGSSASINLRNAPISYSDTSTTLSIVSTPTGLTQSANSSSGVVTVSVASATSSLVGGTYPITYQLTSGSNTYISYLNVTVLDPNQRSPIVLPIDPRTTSIYLPTILLGTGANVHFCVTQLSSSYSSQISITAPAATGVSQISSGTQLVLEGTNSAVAAVMSQIQLTHATGDAYLLPGTDIRTIQTNVSSTDTGNATCSNGTTQSIQIKPYDLSVNWVQQNTDLGHH